MTTDLCRQLVADIRRMKNMLVDKKLVDEDAAKSARSVYLISR